MTAWRYPLTWVLQLDLVIHETYSVSENTKKYIINVSQKYEVYVL
jgi:hypothetical protein